MSGLKKGWAQTFSNSPRSQKFLAIDKKGVNSKFVKIAGELKRKQTSILFQLRSGHAPLNHHLHRLKKAGSPNCPRCDHHFLLECPAYRRERFHLRRKIGQAAYSLQQLLSEEKIIPHTLKYIGETKRFQATFGDVSPEINNE
ncbi:hypothetical protein GGU10DRAFT_278322 [Lentinula aff. detonsa]|uniref:Uncharacterized protein n=1 Tax=Lentinula aff. detonsa TaxID=2804958 RepID=A0AA38KL12_9AGAR|nr:hypothetical protein GGU10DRAFT_278322 [Lentinula aff. detonsa]